MRSHSWMIVALAWAIAAPLAAQEEAKPEGEEGLRDRLEARRAELQKAIEEQASQVKRKLAETYEVRQRELQEQLEQKEAQVRRLMRQLEQMRDVIRERLERRTDEAPPRAIGREGGEFRVVPGRSPRAEGRAGGETRDPEAGPRVVGRGLAPAQSLARRAAPQPDELDRLRREDPVGFELFQRDQGLSQRARELAGRFRSADGEEQKQEVRAQLNTLLGEHFELRQQLREHEVERLEKQLDRVRGSLKSRAGKREALIERRLNELLGEEEDEF